MRAEFAGPGRTVCDVFADLRRPARSEIIAEDPQRRGQAARLTLEHGEGHGRWELYRLDRELFVATMDVQYDERRREPIPGDGLVNLEVKLSGRMSFAPPGRARSPVVEGPGLCALFQAPGVDTSIEMTPGVRESSVTLYCLPSFLVSLALESGLGRGAALEELCEAQSQGFWYRQLPLTANLLYLAKSFLQSPYHGRMRLLNAEGKALELLCGILEVLGGDHSAPAGRAGDAELRQLDSARRLLRTQFQPVPRVPEVARCIGMSESKLKRAFKARFGITLFDYGLECRMRHALELLKSRRMPVTQVAEAVGYSHAASFTAAFRRFYGFVPKSAHTEIH